MTSPSQQGTSNTGGTLGGGHPAASGALGAPTALNNTRLNAQFPTLNPPKMKTAIYAPSTQIIIMSNGLPIDVSRDLVRGQVVRKENSASSLFFTCANPQLRYTQNSPFHRMDRVMVYMTRTQPIQVFSGYLDTIPWMQAYPGTVDFRATCTLKRLLHTWWNPALPQSLSFFDQMSSSLGTNGDGQGGAATDSGIGSILGSILEKVGNWPPTSIHIQNFPQQFLTFLNNYFVESNMQGNNLDLQNQFHALVTGSDISPGPMSAVGYQGSDPLGTAASAVNSGPQFYLAQIIQAADDRGMGPIVDSTANSQSVQDSANVFESAQAAANPYDAELAKVVAQAGQQVAQYSSNWSTQNANSDAAIIALAAAMVESGGGSSALLMMANNADPDTLTFWHDGVSTNGSSSGLFGLPNTGAWGVPAQRMNPYSSAAMFLDKLNAMTGWRNMDQGQAIWQVLQSSPASIGKYDAAIKEATQLVLAYREAQQGASNAANAALGALPGAGALGGIVGGGSNATGGLGGNALNIATTSPVSTAAGVLGAGRPSPDSEGAVNAASTIVGVPYLYGGTNPSTGIDCSALVQLSFAAIGVTLPRDTYSQKAAIPSVPLNSIQRGDVLQTNYGGHTGIYLGAGQWIQTGGPDGTPGHVEPVPMGGGGLMWAGRVCSNGGADPAAPFSPITGAIPAGTGIPVGTGSGAPGGGGGGSVSGSEPIARNLFSYLFTPAAYASAAANFFTGEKAYIDDIPLMQTITALCQASLRNFQSAPNGDFIAYYPDQFGMDGKPSVLALEDIELTDVHIDLSDDNLTTHVYVEGDNSMIGEADSVMGWLGTCGVATVENQALFQRLASVAPGDVDQNMSGQALMARFGVRPYKNSYSMAGNGGLEFLLACTTFMGKWAGQYETDIGLTFMPELYPGMRIILVGHNLSVYVSAVTHQFDYQQGFRTMATVSAASNPNAANSIYSSLPGFLNPVSTNQTGGGNTTNTGQPATGGFQAPLPGGPLDRPAGSFPSLGSPFNNGIG